MKSNRIIWGLVSLVILTTVAVTLGTFEGLSQEKVLGQQKLTPTPENSGYEDWSKYPLVDYNEPEPFNALEREEKKLKNKRYDNKGILSKKEPSEDEGISLTDEIPPSLAIPAIESYFVIVGEIRDAKASLSNDKRGIYSEYTVQILEILKGDGSNKAAIGTKITVDRSGGIVRYPNGKKVFYSVSGKNLPKVGSEYVLFVTSDKGTPNDKRSPNYEILTGYELKDGIVYPLDAGGRFDEFKGTKKPNFLEAIRNRINTSSQPLNK